MKNKTIISVVILLLVVSVSVSFAQSSAPETVVKELYKIHDQDLKNSSDRILSGENRQNLDKFFDKTLADYIWKDLTTERDEIGVLDFDPFYNAQDFEIKKLSISKGKIIGSKATVVAKFQNFGAKVSLTYQLIRQNSAWKISDIKYADGSSLVGYFKEDAKTTK